MALTQNPLLGACFAYKIRVPTLSGRQARCAMTVCQKMQILVSGGSQGGGQRGSGRAPIPEVLQQAGDVVCG